MIYYQIILKKTVLIIALKLSIDEPVQFWDGRPPLRYCKQPETEQSLVNNNYQTMTISPFFLFLKTFKFLKSIFYWFMTQKLLQK